LEKTCFRFSKNRFLDREKPVVGSAETGFEVGKTSFKIGKNRFLGLAKTGFGVGENRF